LLLDRPKDTAIHRDKKLKLNRKDWQMQKRLVLFGWLCLLTLPAMAQAQMSTAPVEMKKLDFLLGEWQGEGWIEMGPSQRHSFRQTERLQPKAGGSLVLIEGLGVERVGDKDVPVHQAFAVVTYDNQTKRFKLRAWRAAGDEVVTEPEVDERSLIWGFRDPRSGTQIKFTIKLNDKGQWFEIGEASRDGQSWRKFFETTLQKAGK
jgi:hypothetical protein